MAGSPTEFVVTRVLALPRELVWKAWTEREYLERWRCPDGSPMRVVKLDLRVGGLFVYAMPAQAGPGRELFGRSIYREIVPPQRLVFINSYADANGEIARAHFSPTWPLEIINTLTLTEHARKTTLTLRGGPINATDEERETFVAMIDTYRLAFASSIDQLAEYLTKASGA